MDKDRNDGGKKVRREPGKEGRKGRKRWVRRVRDGERQRGIGQ